MITSNSLQFFSEKLRYCSTIFRRSIGGIGDPLPILTSERHCHSERLFLYPIMLPIDLISCKLVLQLFLICTFNFSGLLLLPVQTFLECVALMKSKMSQYLAWHFKMSHFQHLICYLYSIVNKIYVYEICKLLHSFLFKVCTVSQLFWNRVCTWKCNTYLYSHKTFEKNILIQSFFQGWIKVSKLHKLMVQ